MRYQNYPLSTVARRCSLCLALFLTAIFFYSSLENVAANHVPEWQQVDPPVATTPLLIIPDRMTVQPGAPITVPVVFTANGQNVTAAVFSIDYDENWLTFDATDSDANGIPDAVRVYAPATFDASIMVNLNDHDGELDIVIADFFLPFASLPNGTIVEIVFQAGQPLETTEAAITFSTAPAISFSTPTGQNIPLPPSGGGDGGSALILVPPTPTATATTSATPTNTPTTTATATATDTATATATDTPTNTPTASETASHTATATATAIPTHTPSATVTPMPTYTLMATPTATATATFTPIPTTTGTATPTATQTAMPTVIPSATPTNTATPCPTHAPIPVPGGCATITATVTATPTATSTQTPTFTPPNTPTATARATDTATATTTPIATATVTSTETAPPTGTPAPTDTATATTTPLATATVTSTETAPPTETPAPTDTATATTVAVTVTPTDTPTITPTDTALPTATTTATDTPMPTATTTATATPPVGPTPSGPIPVITGLTPAQGLATVATNLQIQGANFVETPQVALGSYPLISVVWLDAGQLIAVVPAGLPPGLYDLTVTNPGGQRAVQAGAFRIQTDNLVILQVRPNRGETSIPADINLYGFAFADGATIRLSTTPVTTLASLYVNPLHLRTTVPAGLTPGVYDLTVTNPNGDSATLAAAYQVINPALNDDLFGQADTLWSDPTTVRAQSTVNLGLVVYRQGGRTPLANVLVHFYQGDPQSGGLFLGAGNIPLLAPRSAASTTALQWTPLTAGAYTLFAVIDPNNSVAEGDETNNIIQRDLTVLPAAADSLAPHVDAFAINDGARQSTAQTVLLDVTASDPTTPPPSSGVGALLYVEYEYSLGAGLWIPVQFSEWLPYTTAHSAFPWSLLPSAGMKYLQAWAADNAGNITPFPGQAIINYLPPTDHVAQNQARIYRYTLAAGQQLTARVEPVSGDPDLYIWPPDYTTRPPWVSNLAGDGVVDEIELTAPIAGVYQVEVYGYSEAAYRLSITLGEANAASPSREEGNNITAEKVLPTQPLVAMENIPTRYQSLPAVPSRLITPVIYLPLVRQ